jgi:hypothetical protein
MVVHLRARRGGVDLRDVVGPLEPEPLIPPDEAGDAVLLPIIRGMDKKELGALVMQIMVGGISVAAALAEVERGPQIVPVVVRDE